MKNTTKLDLIKGRINTILKTIDKLIDNSALSNELKLLIKELELTIKKGEKNE